MNLQEVITRVSDPESIMRLKYSLDFIRLFTTTEDTNEREVTHG